MSSAVQILKEEYGISTLEQLNAALKKMGGLDISPFTAEINSRSKRNERQSKIKSEKKAC